MKKIAKRLMLFTGLFLMIYGGLFIIGGNPAFFGLFAVLILTGLPVFLFIFGALLFLFSKILELEDKLAIKQTEIE